METLFKLFSDRFYFAILSKAFCKVSSGRFYVLDFNINNASEKTSVKLNTCLNRVAKHMAHPVNISHYDMFRTYMICNLDIRVWNFWSAEKNWKFRAHLNFMVRNLVPPSINEKFGYTNEISPTIYWWFFFERILCLVALMGSRVQAGRTGACVQVRCLRGLLVRAGARGGRRGAEDPAALHPPMGRRRGVWVLGWLGLCCLGLKI